MPKFKVWLSRCYEIEVEADNEADAFDQALSTPTHLWDDSGDIEYGVEAIEEEQTNV